jgi:hypothetical protein
MANTISKNINIKHGDHVYKFLNCKLQPSDGSFYVTLRRDGNINSVTTISRFGNQELNIESEDVIFQNNIRISYHSSGCILYRNTKLNLITTNSQPENYT